MKIGGIIVTETIEQKLERLKDKYAPRDFTWSRNEATGRALMRNDINDLNQIDRGYLEGYLDVLLEKSLSSSEMAVLFNSTEPISEMFNGFDEIIADIGNAKRLVGRYMTEYVILPATDFILRNPDENEDDDYYPFEQSTLVVEYNELRRFIKSNIANANPEIIIKTAFNMGTFETKGNALKAIDKMLSKYNGNIEDANKALKIIDITADTFREEAAGKTLASKKLVPMLGNAYMVGGSKLLNNIEKTLNKDYSGFLSHSKEYKLDMIDTFMAYSGTSKIKEITYIFTDDFVKLYGIQDNISGESVSILCNALQDKQVMDKINRSRDKKGLRKILASAMMSSVMVQYAEGEKSDRIDDVKESILHMFDNTKVTQTRAELTSRKIRGDYAWFINGKLVEYKSNPLNWMHGIGFYQQQSMKKP